MSYELTKIEVRRACMEMAVTYAVSRNKPDNYLSPASVIRIAEAWYKHIVGKAEIPEVPSPAFGDYLWPDK